MPPEFVLGEEYSGALVDLYQIGIITFMMRSSKFPYFEPKSTDTLYSLFVSD